MSRVISVRLTDAEQARIRGAAAITGLSLSAYLKWLVTNAKTGTQNDTEMILRRLDSVATAIANIGADSRQERVVPVVGVPVRSAIVSRLKERGLPSSTIRQVEAALDEIEGKAAPMNTNVNTESQTRQRVG